MTSSSSSSSSVTEQAQTLLAPGVNDNPYPFYDAIRAEQAAYLDPVMGRWLIMNYADASAALKDTRFSSGGFTKINDQMTENSPVVRSIAKWMVAMDAPDHTRIRSLVSKAFTPKVLEGMRGRIEEIVNELLDKVQDKGQMDIIADLAYPLPAIVIAEMLGVEPAKRDMFKKWSNDIVAFSGAMEVSEEIINQAEQSVKDMTEYFREVVAERRQHPKNDLMTALIMAEEQGDKLTEDEMFANCVLLLIAGHETTTNLIGNGILALMQNPDQMQLLKHNPEMIGSAVEELLRFNSPVQWVPRITVAEVEVDGTVIPAGQVVLVGVGAANHDPAQFTNPDMLNIQRKEGRSMSFGYGAHHCLGAALVRIEAPIAINELLRRMPNMQMTTDKVEWNEHFILRGLKALPVSF